MSEKKQVQWHVFKNKLTDTWQVLSDDDLEALKDNLDQLADRLIEIANENGGRDNVSVLLAKPNKEFPSKKDWKKKFSKFLPR